MDLECKVREVIPRVFQFEYPDQYWMCSTNCRFQESYESATLRGVIFTHEDIMDDEIRKDEDREFNYFSQTKGMNFPSWVLHPFYEGAFDPLWKKEVAFLESFKEHMHKSCYIICTYEEEDGQANKADFMHELAHGLWFTVQEYQAAVREVTSRIKAKSLKKFLKRKNYHNIVWEDEIHAWILADLAYLKAEEGIITRPYEKVQKELQKIFKRFCPNFDELCEF